MPEVRLHWMRPNEVVAAQAAKSIAYFPVGPLEWHGPHLPLGTDPLLAEAVALALAEKIGGVVHPTLFWGTERERNPETLRNLGFHGDEWIIGMDFPGMALRSFYVPEEQFALVARWNLENLITHGFRLVVIVNGHGATNQIAQLKRLATELTAQGPAGVLYTFPLEHVTSEPGHATITETSAILALDAGRVDLATLPSIEQALRISEWAIADAASFSGDFTPERAVNASADPRHASAGLGRRNFEAAVNALAAIVDPAWDQVVGSLAAATAEHPREAPS
jgi:creatinine amidohydrolase